MKYRTFRVSLFFLSFLLLTSTVSAKDDILKSESEITKDETYKVYLPGKVGKAYSEGYYRDGKKKGRHRSYKVKTKKLLEICHYHMGEKHGLCKKYYPENGQLYKVVQFFTGVPHGPYQVFYPNGQRKSQVKYVYGRKQGKEKLYDEKGKLIEVVEYNKGKRVEKK